MDILSEQRVGIAVTVTVVLAFNLIQLQILEPAEECSSPLDAPPPLQDTPQVGISRLRRFGVRFLGRCIEFLPSFPGSVAARSSACCYLGPGLLLLAGRLHELDLARIEIGPDRADIAERLKRVGCHEHHAVHGSLRLTGVDRHAVKVA